MVFGYLLFPFFAIRFRILYGEKEKPDHVVVIKYVPYVGDSKRAMDEYTSEIFLGGKVKYSFVSIDRNDLIHILN